MACIDINFVSDQDDAGLFDSFASNIAESTYDGMNVDNVIKENCSHLTKEQQKDLRELLLLRFLRPSGRLGVFVGNSYLCIGGYTQNATPTGRLGSCNLRGFYRCLGLQKKVHM